MATNLSNVTFSNVYKDDFTDSDNYHRILFNSGKALQARELTQSQTIIQKEIERFGANIFKQGGAVNGGNLTIDNKVEYINLANGELPSSPATLVGKYYKDSTNGVIVKIKEVIVSDGSTTEPDGTARAVDTLIVDYINTTGGTPGAAPIRVGAGQVLQRITTATNLTLVSDASNYPDMTITSGYPSSGKNIAGLGTKVHIDRGSFFVQGHFVFCKAQSLTIARFSSTPDQEIGFQIDEEVVTVSDDTALYDNQGSSPNLSSPGADRYRITLTLKTKTAAGSNNFVYLANVAKGQVSDAITVNDSYKKINDLMALRTKEESGNYIVKRFDINPSSINTTTNKINYNVSDGIAYVDGYRLDLDQKSLEIARPVTTESVDDEEVGAVYGNYVLVHGENADSAGIKNKGLPDIHGYKKISLYSNNNAGGGTTGGNIADIASIVIGSARARAIYKDATNKFRVHLFDIRMKSGKSFGEVRSMGLGTTNNVTVVTEGGQAVLKGSSSNSLLFPLPHNRPKYDGLTGTTNIVQKKMSFTSSGSSVTNENCGGLPSGVDKFYGGSNWIVTARNGNVVPVTITPVAGNTTFTISSGLSSGTYDVYAQVQMSGSTNVSERSKTLMETTLTKAWPGAADSDNGGGKFDMGGTDGLKFLSLDKADIFSVKSIKIADSAGADISDNFTIDNGQRDNYYGIGRIIPKSDAVIPTANIFVRFQYFKHEASVTGVGGQKCYFSATSYKNNTSPSNSIDGVGVTYETIPNYTKSDGSIVSLRDVLDYRPVAVLQHCNDSAYSAISQLKDNAPWNITFDSNGPEIAGADPLIHLIPQVGGNTSFSAIEYYLPRKDRLVANSTNLKSERVTQGSVDYITGTPSFTPQLPAVPSGAMTLYNLTLGGNTINKQDILTEPVSNKRFTMGDIARLERRIDTLDELTTLSLLELNTSTLNVIDSAGNPRTKAGFLVDNFKDYTFTDVANSEQRASIDPQAGTIAPLVISKVNRITYDSADGASTATQRGDNLYLTMQDSAVTYINQNLATMTENVNPFAVIRSLGHIELSPSSDTWIETSFAADEVNGGGTTTTTIPTNVQFGSLAAFRDNWIGQPTSWDVGDTSVAASGRRRDFSRTSTRSVTISGGFDTVTTQVGERTLSVSILPFMRSIKVYFRAQGLRRKTRHFPYFGGTAIDNFTRQETFARYSSRGDAGAVNPGATAHPDGSNNLTSDSNGVITGSFIIPSNNSLSFNTGIQQFKLLDVTGGVDSNSVSSANTSFTATGTLEVKQRILTSTRVERVQTIVEESTQQWTTWVDPLAQSFLIDPVEDPNGVFITKIKLYFSTKDDNFGVPVQVQIRPMENGLPTNQPLPGAVKFMQPADVSVTASSGANIGTVQGAGTDFRFDEPVYLAPGEEYAVVVLAETTAYNLYVAETYEFVLGTTSQRIAKQPTLGSLFKSQNGSTWTPDQTKDLMFTMYRANFNTSATALLEAKSWVNGVHQSGKTTLGANPFQTTASNNKIRVYHAGHGFQLGDKVTFSGATATGGIAASALNTTHNVVEVDATGYNIQSTGTAFNPSSSARGGGTAVISTSNIAYNTFIPQVTNLLVNNTTLTAGIKHIKGYSYGSSTARRTGRTFSADGSYLNMILNEFNYTEQTAFIQDKSQTNAGGGMHGPEMLLTLGTSDTKVSPVIDLQRCNFIGFENLIDDQYDATHYPITFINETDASSGTHAAKHVTRAVTLDESAVGLKVLVAANRPQVCSLVCYYRVATADEDLATKSWTLQAEETNNPADDDNETFREYEWLPGGQVGNLSTFTKFQVKIVMKSKNQSKVPTLKDLRIIAMVT